MRKLEREYIPLPMNPMRLNSSEQKKTCNHLYRLVK